MTLWSWSRVFGAPLNWVVTPLAVPAIDVLTQECIETPLDLVLREALDSYPRSSAGLVVNVNKREYCYTAAMRSAVFPAPDRPGSEFASSAWVSWTDFMAVCTHPAMQRAVTEHAAWLIENYSGNVLLNMLLCDRGRLIVGLFVAYLGVLPSPGTTTSGVTLTAVQKLCQQTRLCSAGRAAALLAAMRFGGYVSPVSDPEDRRRRVLAPTAKLIGLQTESWSRLFASMAPLLPEPAFVPRALQRPAFRTGFLHALGSHFLGGFRLLDHVPVLAPLAESNAGLLVLVSLALPHIKGENRPGEPTAVSISALSRRFCISRAHLRKLLLGAESAGLIASSPQANVVVVLPSLPEAVLTFYAVLFVFYHRCANTAARDEWRWQQSANTPN